MSEFLKLKLKHLQKETANLHSSLDVFIKMVSDVGDAWIQLEKSRENEVDFEEMNSMLEKTILYIRNLHLDISADPIIAEDMLFRMRGIASITEISSATDVGYLTTKYFTKEKSFPGPIIAADDASSQKTNAQLNIINRSSIVTLGQGHFVEERLGRSNVFEKKVKKLISDQTGMRRKLSAIFQRQDQLEAQSKRACKLHEINYRLGQRHSVAFGKFKPNIEERVNECTDLMKQEMTGLSNTLTQDVVPKQISLEQQINELIAKLATLEQLSVIYHSIEEQLKILKVKQEEYESLKNLPNEITDIKLTLEKQSNDQILLQDMASKYEKLKKQQECLQTDVPKQLQNVTCKHVQLEKEVAKLNQEVKEYGTFSTNQKILEKNLAEMASTHYNHFENHAKRLNELEKQMRKIRSEMGKNQEKINANIEAHRSKVLSMEATTVRFLDQFGIQMGLLNEMKNFLASALDKVYDRLNILESQSCLNVESSGVRKKKK